MAKTKVHGEYLDPSVISAQTEVTAVGSDHMLIFDATDNALKKALLSDLIETVGSTPTFTGLTVNSSEVLFDNTSGDFTLKLNTNAVGDKNEIIMGDTSTPLAKFGVGGTANDIITGSDGQDFNIGTAGGGRAINFSTDNFASVEMKLDGGNLGIGTSSVNANAKLHVQGAGDSQILIYETGTSPYTATLKLASQSTTAYGANVQYTSGAEQLTIENFGRTISSTQAHGSIRFRTKVGNSSMQEVLHINGYTGNVGIGTTPASHYTGYEALDIGDTLFLFSNNTGTNVSTLTNNGFLNSDASQWTYKVTDEATMYSQVHGDHRFSTAASGSANAAISWSEKVRIQNAGGISFNGDTAAANALDDYEEGNWTPVLTVGGGSFTYSYRAATYRKVGNMVNIIGGFGLSGISSPTGNLGISGLPFTNGSGEGYVASVSFSVLRNFSQAFDQFRGYVNSGGTSITLAVNNENTGHSYPSANTLTATTQIYFSVTYNVA